jgi:mannitol-specific phosphotransferase system IIBC component
LLVLILQCKPDLFPRQEQKAKSKKQKAKSKKQKAKSKKQKAKSKTEKQSRLAFSCKHDTLVCCCGKGSVISTMQSFA